VLDDVLENATRAALRKPGDTPRFAAFEFSRTKASVKSDDASALRSPDIAT